jgi:putative transposase
LRGLVEAGSSLITIEKQCSLLDLSKSSYYYHPHGITPEELVLMGKIDKVYTKNPFCGSRRIVDAIFREEEIKYNRKRIQRLMRIMGIEAIRPKRNLSKAGKESIIFPYLLKGLEITGINHVWSTDITYIPMKDGFFYLTAVIDWFSRYILSWEISSTLDVYFCLNALETALRNGQPKIFNTDQGSQFTSKKFTEYVLGNNMQFSMDSKGRALDNIFIERFWRSLKYENIYLNDYRNGEELQKGLDNYFNYYNFSRGHQSLKYKTPAEIYFTKESIK